MNMVPNMPMREILIALPDLPLDLYRMHQCVWDHASRAARPGVRPVFLYRVQDGIVRVRSRDFARGTVREFRAGCCSLDVAAVVQSPDGERAVAHADLAGWASKKLAQAGFRTKGLEVVSYEFQHGEKRDRQSGRCHRIALPIARLYLDLEVENKDRATAAWHNGIGRGRRFGLGMLCH
jgi:hypothetical protein